MQPHDDSQNAVVVTNLGGPIDLIWQTWTAPEHFGAWYGPDGASIPVAKMDVRVGGSRLVCMEVQTPRGPMQMWFAGEYRGATEHQRLVYTESVSDENDSPLAEHAGVAKDIPPPPKSRSSSRPSAVASEW